MIDYKKRGQIAKLLSDKLIIYNTNNDGGICWNDSDKPVRETEWLYIVHYIEYYYLQLQSNNTLMINFSNILKELNYNESLPEKKADIRMEAILKYINDYV